MICTLCRSTVPADALVCPECGDLVQAQVELSAPPAGGYGAFWIALGLTGLVVVLIVAVGLAMGESVDGGPACIVALLLAFLWVPPLLTHGRGRRLLGTMAGRKPNHGVRDLTYLSRLRTEAAGSGSPPAIRYFATFASLAEFKIESEQYKQLKGCEGQRMVVTYIPERHELVEFVPAPPTG